MKAISQHNILLNGFGVYIHNVLIPIVLSCLYMGYSMCTMILGIDGTMGLSDAINLFWIKYFFNGEILGIVAWRIHLLAIIICNVFALIDYCKKF